MYILTQALHFYCVYWKFYNVHVCVRFLFVERSHFDFLFFTFVASGNTAQYLKVASCFGLGLHAIINVLYLHLYIIIGGLDD